MTRLFLVVVSLLVLNLSFPAAAEELQPPAYEYAIVKWDGPDRVYFNLPNKFEVKYLSKEGVTIPREAQAEEFCLAWAANKMAKEGWSPIDFDSRRILFRRVSGR